MEIENSPSMFEEDILRYGERRLVYCYMKKFIDKSQNLLDFFLVFIHKNGTTRLVYLKFNLNLKISLSAFTQIIEFFFVSVPQSIHLDSREYYCHPQIDHTNKMDPNSKPSPGFDIELWTVVSCYCSSNFNFRPYRP